VSKPIPGSSHVRAINVEKRYLLGSNEVLALRGISLEVGHGEYVSLCGSSGSGKTTLLNLIGCLDVPSTGEIYISDRNISRMTDKELAGFRASQLGFVFQTFNLLPVLSAIENVEYPLIKQSLSNKERLDKARAALARVGLEKFGTHRPDQLSGGQRQRVAIARAFVHGPELIIADEPTANLDKKTSGEILDLIGELNVSLGITVIVATHDPKVMERTRRTVQISDGHLK
jgi:putative ABC transport system ATP-binding protein